MEGNWNKPQPVGLSKNVHLNDPGQSYVSRKHASEVNIYS